PSDCNIIDIQLITTRTDVGRTTGRKVSSLYSVNPFTAPDIVVVFCDIMNVWKGAEAGNVIARALSSEDPLRAGSWWKGSISDSFLGAADIHHLRGGGNISPIRVMED
ncbi:hypothetical protein ACJX0J_000440, partial (mitochondrion) [Zea mays]